MNDIFELPRLRTDRLLLRAFYLRDLDALAAMSADPEVMAHMGIGAGFGQIRSRLNSWRHM
jgi:RimJ/RimL family protein N-acetyltransferase